MRRIVLLLYLVLPLIADVNSTVYLPQIVDGGGWQTTFTIVNLSPLSEGQATLHLWSSKGDAMALPFGNIVGTRSQVNITIPGGGIFILSTAGTAAETTAGWADLDVTSSGHLAITALLRSRTATGGEFEVLVPSRQVSTRSQVFVFDHQASATGLATVNASRVTELYVDVIIRNEAGKIIETTTGMLAAGQHGVLNLADSYPITANQRGTIEFAPRPGGWLAVMGLRFSKTGPITSLDPLTP